MEPTSPAGNQIITPEDYQSQLMGESTTVTVSGVVPASGVAYVTIHLDYGLKRTSQWKPTGTWTINPVTGLPINGVRNGLGSGPITIHGYEVYDFSWSDDGVTPDYSSTPSSINEFKRFAGFLGFVTVDGNPMPGVPV